jgi:hypothetical protein
VYKRTEQKKEDPKGEEKQLSATETATTEGTESGCDVKPKIAHQARGMLRMQHPTNTFGQGITWIDDDSKMGEVDVTGFAPILYGEVLDANVA